MLTKKFYRLFSQHYFNFTKCTQTEKNAPLFCNKEELPGGVRS